MRLFVAAEIGSEVRARLSRLVEDLQPLPLEVRWVRPGGTHLTFKFLGEVPEDRLERIGAAIGPVTLGRSPFELEAAGLGFFPGSGAPRVVWVGLRGDLEAAKHLHRVIDTALVTAGFGPDDRPFRPHLTIGRVRGPGRGDWRPAYAERSGIACGGFRVQEVVLFRSHLGPGGASHEALRRFPLAGGEAG